MYCTLELLKNHLNIESDYTAEDTYITHLYNVAEARVEEHINIPLEAVAEEDGTLPPPIVHAIMLLVGSLYNFRESELTTATTSVSHGYEYLLAPYKNYSDLYSDVTYTEIVDEICQHLYISNGDVCINDEWLNNRSETYRRIAERILSTATIENGCIKISTL